MSFAPICRFGQNLRTLVVSPGPRILRGVATAGRWRSSYMLAVMPVVAMERGLGRRPPALPGRRRTPGAAGRAEREEPGREEEEFSRDSPSRGVSRWKEAKTGGLGLGWRLVCFHNFES